MSLASPGILKIYKFDRLIDDDYDNDKDAAAAAADVMMDVFQTTRGKPHLYKVVMPVDEVCLKVGTIQSENIHRSTISIFGVIYRINYTKSVWSIISYQYLKDM